MYSYVYLTKRNMKYFQKLNGNRKLFNVMNEDFYEQLYNLSFTKQLFLCRKVKLLRANDKLVGYIWVSKLDKKNKIINSMYINEEYSSLDTYQELIKLVKDKLPILYTCEKNNSNYDLLSKLGFTKQEGTYDMYAKIDLFSKVDLERDISFENLQRGIQEAIRCKIQNEVFKNDSRIPLTVEDIYYDEAQEYYLEEGSILVKKGDNYIGYGQIIINGKVPTIVNVGILEEYRGRGYGKTLINHLFRILLERGFKEVNLKVSSNNETALNLYKSMGFSVKSETHKWELKKIG